MAVGRGRPPDVPPPEPHTVDVLRHVVFSNPIDLFTGREMLNGLSP